VLMICALIIIETVLV